MMRKLMNVIEGIEENTPIAFDTETTSLDTRKMLKLLGFPSALMAKMVIMFPLRTTIWEWAM